MNDAAPKKALTHDDLRKAAEAIKDPSFSAGTLEIQYYHFAQAAADAAERESNDANRFATFVSTMQSQLSVFSLSGTRYWFLPSSDCYCVARGDTSLLWAAEVSISGRCYMCASVPPRD